MKIQLTKVQSNIAIQIKMKEIKQIKSHQFFVMQLASFSQLPWL